MAHRGKKGEQAPAEQPTSSAGTSAQVADRPAEGTTRPGGTRAGGRGPAAGIGSPIYDELVAELGDPAA